MGGEHWSVSGSGNGESLLSLLIGNCLCLQVFISFHESFIFNMLYFYAYWSNCCINLVIHVMNVEKKKKNHTV